jgi:LacI family transcriptional regulator
MRRKQPVTIYDIAAKAEVSPATVSRVFNRSTQVSEAKKEAVLAAAAALNYRPNPLAQDLASGYSKTVGLLLPDPVSSFWGRLVKGVENALREHDYHLLMASADGSEGEQRALDLLVSHHVDALIVGGGHLDDGILIALAEEMPLVAVCRSLSGREDCRVHVPNREGAYRAVRHLIELGHTRIAHVAGPAGHPDADDRYQGYQDALADAGLLAPEGLVSRGDWMSRSGVVATEALFAGGQAWSAVFAASDQMALGAVLTLYHHGLDVPRDVSVVGFDDELFSAFCRPPLTTVGQPMSEIGQAAVRTVLARLRGEDLPLPAFEAPLRLRESTAPYRRGQGVAEGKRGAGARARVGATLEER